MDFKYVVTTPADTALADAVDTKLKLTAGVITKVKLLHPEGCHALAHASVWHGGHQRYPRNAPDDYHGNADPFETEDNFELHEPAELTLKTWNEDDTYEHRVFVHITVLRPRVDPFQQAMIDLLKIIRTLLTGRRLT